MTDLVNKGLDAYAIYKLCGFAIIGFCLVSICSIITYKNYYLLEWKNTTANIINSSCEKYNKIENNKSVINYNCSLDIEFSDNNTIIKAKHNIDSAKLYNVGETINIKYNPKKPTEVVNSSDSYIVYIGSGTTVIGLIMLILGCYGIKYCMKNNCAVLGGIFATTDVIQSVSTRR